MSPKLSMVGPYTRRQCAVMHLFYIDDIREIKPNQLFYNRAAVNASMALYCSINRCVMMCRYIPITGSPSHHPNKRFDICYTCADKTCPGRFYFARCMNRKKFRVSQVLEHTCSPDYRRKPHCFGKLLGTLFAPEYFKRFSITREAANAVLQRWRACGIAIHVPRGYDILHAVIRLAQRTEYLVGFIKWLGVEKFLELLKDDWGIPKSVLMANGFDIATVQSYLPKTPGRIVASDELGPSHFTLSSESSETTDEKSSDSSGAIGPSVLSVLTSDDSEESEDSEDSPCEDCSLGVRRREPDETTATSGLERVDGGTRETKAPRLELPESLSKEQTQRTSEETVEQKASHEDNCVVKVL